ncbi:hypothetical protein [Micromonospora profundi]|uniref:hypothetical protein n=1 Tax=Micromonospora profundi TaxID=1420889 RepID=UPI003647B5D0
MSPQANDNTPKAVTVRQGRTRTRFLPNGSVEQRVTRPDNTRVWAPVNDRYQSRVPFGHDKVSGAFDARTVTS